MHCLKLDILSLSSLKHPNRDTDVVCGLAVSVVSSVYRQSLKSRLG